MSSTIGTMTNTTGTAGAVRTPQPMTIDQVAEEFGVPVKTLRSWRYAGHGGPRSFKLGKRVIYDRADVLAWYEAQRAAGDR